MGEQRAEVKLQAWPSPCKYCSKQAQLPKSTLRCLWCLGAACIHPACTAAAAQSRPTDLPFPPPHTPADPARGCSRQGGGDGRDASVESQSSTVVKADRRASAPALAAAPHASSLPSPPLERAAPALPASLSPLPLPQAPHSTPATHTHTHTQAHQCTSRPPTRGSPSAWLRTLSPPQPGRSRPRRSRCRCRCRDGNPCRAGRVHRPSLGWRLVKHTKLVAPQAAMP